MALRAPSLQSDYSLCFSEDCSLDLPVLDGLEGEALDAAAAERSRLINVARDTGNWAAITKPGEKPTVFKIRPIYPHAMWIDAEATRRDLKTRGEIYELVFRLAVVGADNFGKWSPKFDEATDETPRMLKRESLAEIYSVGLGSPDPHIGTRLVMEIGGTAHRHAMDGVRPLS